MQNSRMDEQPWLELYWQSRLTWPLEILFLACSDGLKLDKLMRGGICTHDNHALRLEKNVFMFLESIGKEFIW